MKTDHVNRLADPENLYMPVRLIYLDFQPLEVVSHYHDPQPQVIENYLESKHLQILMFKQSLHTQ